jgi:hypothetical protein
MLRLLAVTLTKLLPPLDFNGGDRFGCLANSDWEPRTVAASVRRRWLVAFLLGREVRCDAV